MLAVPGRFGHNWAVEEIDNVELPAHPCRQHGQAGRQTNMTDDLIIQEFLNPRWILPNAHLALQLYTAFVEVYEA